MGEIQKRIRKLLLLSIVITLVMVLTLLTATSTVQGMTPSGTTNKKTRNPVTAVTENNKSSTLGGAGSGTSPTAGVKNGAAAHIQWSHADIYYATVTFNTNGGSFVPSQAAKLAIPRRRRCNSY